MWSIWSLLVAAVVAQADHKAEGAVLVVYLLGFLVSLLALQLQ